MQDDGDRSFIYIKGYTERKHKEMATSMGRNNERGDY
jgi:hypothetical protein